MSLRLFAAFEPPPEVVARVAALQRGVPGASWRPRENLHVTLRFFGDVAENVARDLDSALEEAAQGLAPFDVRLKGAGSFGKDAPHTLWLGLAECPPLHRLAGDVERAARRIGLAPEGRKFAPHLTVAYLHGADVARVQAFERRCALFESAPWRVEGFGLYSSQLRRSQPSLYRLEAEYPLLG
jgi:2'-5' RNA ligase